MINTELLPLKKVAQIIGATSVIFTKTTQSKQSPNGRKFAKYGHPDHDRQVCFKAWF
jgi:hypothetical protein